VTALLVSDRERDYTIELLRGHLLSGRLTAEEFEERVDEVCRARYADDLWRALRELPVERPPAPARPAGAGSAVGSVVTGIVGMSLLVMSFGLLFIVTLPLGLVAHALGRKARRSGAPNRGAAIAGEALGAVTAGISLLLLVGCALIVT
jgi:hypothetical protein